MTTDKKGLWINLGCCDDFREGFVNVDRIQCTDADRERYGAITHDLNFSWPFVDSSADYILARDIIEHLHDGIYTMNEAWRVLKSGGIFEIEVPTTEGRGAFQDPSHHTFWNRNSFFYYTHGDPHRERFGKAYGIEARFEVVREETVRLIDEVVKLHIILKATK